MNNIYKEKLKILIQKLVVNNNLYELMIKNETYS